MAIWERLELCLERGWSGWGKGESIAHALRGQAVKERREAIRRKQGDGGKSGQGTQCPGSAGPGHEEKQVGLLNILSVKERLHPGSLCLGKYFHHF